MHGNYRILLIISILLPINMLNAAQSKPEIKQVAEQQTEKKQDKPTLRSKIIKWGGITIGIFTGVAIAAKVYFEVQHAREITKLNQDLLVDSLEEAKSLKQLEYLNQTYESFRTKASQAMYIKRKAELEQEMKSKTMSAIPQYQTQKEPEVVFTPEEQELANNILKAQDRVTLGHELMSMHPLMKSKPKVYDKLYQIYFEQSKKIQSNK